MVSHEPREHLKRFCRVLTAVKVETWKDYTVFKSVTGLEAVLLPKCPMDGLFSSKPNESYP